MPANKWFLKTIEQTPTTTGFVIVVQTDVPCHLWMRWTTVPPRANLIQRAKRGLPLPCDMDYYFVTYEDNEQEEAGDTLEHTFIKEPWPICETRYFYFHGEIAGVASKSTSPIFSKHRAHISIDLPWCDPSVSQEERHSTNYALCHDAPIADRQWSYLTPSNRWRTLPSRYEVTRAFITHDTTSLPSNATILSADLHFYNNLKKNDDPNQSDLHIVEGIYPLPITTSAYGQHLPQITSGGMIPYNQIQGLAWNKISLNSIGLLWIKPGQLTKLCLRLSGDINITIPTGDNRVSLVKTWSAGLPQTPYLKILYNP